MIRFGMNCLYLARRYRGPIVRRPTGVGVTKSVSQTAPCSTVAHRDVVTVNTDAKRWLRRSVPFRLTFAMLADDPARLTIPDDAPEGSEPQGPFEFCDPLQAAMLDAITGHPYGPDLDDLGPVAPAG